MKFNPHLTYGEFTRLSNAARLNWIARYDAGNEWRSFDDEPRGFNDEIFNHAGTPKSGMSSYEWGE